MELQELFATFEGMKRNKGRTLLLIGVFLQGVLGLLGQTHIIRGTLENAEKGQVFLAAYHGDRFTAVDSMQTTSGDFHFLFGEDSEPGLYRIIFSDRINGVRSDNRFFEFIFNRENVEVYVASGERGPVPYFDNSPENQVYGEFMEFELNYEARVMMAYGQLPAPEAVKTYDSIQLERNGFMDSLTTRYPDLYAIRMMNAFRSPTIPGAKTHKQRLDTLKTCFFDHAAIDDPLLLNAPVYTFKIIDYLSLFKVDTLSVDQQEIQFGLAVDGIMARVSDDPQLRSFVTGFLLEGFESLGMERVQMHIVENYLDQNCESDVAKVVLSRMEGYKAMTMGARAPDFKQLSLLDNPYVLVIFWSSTCDFCRDMLSQLNSWYQSQNQADLEVVAISLDESKLDYERYTESLKPRWVHMHDPLGWEGKVAVSYSIYATPSLFLLDRERIILAKPTSYRQFLQAVKRLEP